MVVWSVVALLVAAGCSNGCGSAAGEPPSGPATPAGQPTCETSVESDVPQPATNLTNPLFPISDLHSVVLNGTVDDKPFGTETTLLPDTRVIEWIPGQFVRVLVSEYVAYLDGRIEEVALDFYAQADDGSVWYFGEDVFNYDGGAVADLSGTWLAGKEGPQR
jgi:hypothetical protein